MKTAWKYIVKISKIAFITLGIIAFVMCILAFTSIPYWTRYRLGTHDSQYYFKPDCIVMLGGSGMPGEENLMRLYYTAITAKNNPGANIIIAHPPDSGAYVKMKAELSAKGIDSSRIQFETQGTNTRSQALRISEQWPELIKSKIVIVTSPEHILRSVLVFRKIGFKTVGGCPAFDSDMNVDLSYDVKKLGGKKYVPDVSGSISLRYNFWTYLKLEIICLREFAALTYYRLNGWI